MRISVVMATYNGEKYILKQMESIRKQTQKADEVIFCDDGSTDSTLEIVEQYIKQYQLSGWRVVKGQHGGITTNFYNGVSESTGDIIFFSDQDDIWDISKIEKMAHPFKDKTVLTVTCRRCLIDTDDNPIKGYPDFVIYPKVKKNQGRKLNLNEELKYYVCSGLCLAFRKEFFEEIRNFVLKYDLQYDLPFGLVSAVKDGNYTINNHYVRHRIHTDNASAPISTVAGRKGKKKHQIASHKSKLKMLRAVQMEYGSSLKKDELKTIKSAILMHEKYIKAISNGKRAELVKLTIQGNKLISRFLGVADILSTIS